MLTHHLRYATRSLRKSPGFLGSATLLLGLALAVGTTTYAILDGLIHPYTPIREAERVFWLTTWGDGRTGSVTAWDRFVSLRGQSRVFEQSAYVAHEYASVRVGSDVRDMSVLRVSPDYFALLGLKPSMGRLIGGEVESSETAVVSLGLWRSMFAGRSLDDAIVTVGSQTYRVVGVVPDGMRELGVWLSMPVDYDLTKQITPSVRIRDGVSAQAAQLELDALAARLTEEFGTGVREFAFKMNSMVQDSLRLRPLHLALFASAALVLLIACSNLASIMLARGITRRRELAVRLALGASRRTIVTQLGVESAIIAALGCAVAALLTVWSIQILRYNVPPEIHGYLQLATPYVSWRLVLFGMAAAAATVGLFGVLPALRVSGIALSEPLKDSGTTTGRTRRDFGALVVTEVALALMLLMAGALLVRSADQIANYAFGYDQRGLLRSPLWFGQDMPPDSIARIRERLLERVAVVEGVHSVATYAELPGGPAVADAARGGPLGDVVVFRRSYPLVSAGFLRTLGIPIVAGRDFTEGDAAGSGSAIVDETAARKLWPNGEAVGQMVKIGWREEEAAWHRVVGVARDARLNFYTDPDLEPEPIVYVMHAAEVPRRVWLVARVDGDEAAAAMALRRSIESGVPGTRWQRVWVWPWRGQFDQLVSAHRFVARVFVAFGLFALGLAAVGLFGVLAYATSQRMREFGVRVALGAVRRDLFKLVMRDAAVLVLAGTAVGGFAAMAGGQLLEAWLYDLPVTDAVSLVTAELLLVGVSLAASLGPALRAARADPLEILRAT